MICPRCGNLIPANRNYCDVCGADLTAYKKIMRLSNSYYNKGLECAQVRDLSSAIRYLKKSLEMNKRNMLARNLLGLVFFEKGEMVAALGEWVVSKHFNPENNPADDYMERVQSNPAKLDAMNQAIRKYNIALEAAKQGSDDLAILQLKKVVGLNPKFVRARQLLALLYIHTGDKERAKKQLAKAAAIDVADTTTLRYLKEVEEPQQEDSEEENGFGAAGPAKVSKVGAYTEDKPNVMAWVMLVVGMLLGILVTFVLIVPTAKKSIRAEYDKEQLDYSSELRIKEATITSLEKESELWKKKYEETVRQLDAIVIPEAEALDYSSLFQLLRDYLDLLAKEAPALEDYMALAQRVSAVKAEELIDADALSMYYQIKSDVYEHTAQPAYNLGREAYSDENYSDSARYLQAAFDCGYTEDYCYYYLAKSYQLLNEYEQAAAYYRELISRYPDSELVKYARTRLTEMGYAAE